jgi:hypothetical protein
LGTLKVGGVVAFNELELKRIDRTVGELCRRCSPPEHADELRTVHDVEGHTVSMYEERPPWRGEGEWTRMGVARFRYFRSRDEWQLYWMRQDLRWHLSTRRRTRCHAICPRSWRWSTPMQKGVLRVRVVLNKRIKLARRRLYVGLRSVSARSLSAVR